MVNTALLAAFVPTFAVVSLTPGMCMTLAMSMGMTIAAAYHYRVKTTKAPDAPTH